MKNKKVKQTKLLLLDNEIPELSFLTESEKSLLPLILREYTNIKGRRDFSDSALDIEGVHQ